MIKYLLNYLVFQLRHRIVVRQESDIYLYFLAELLKTTSLNVVVVGANDGRIDDPIYEFAMANKSKTRLLLVEPQKEIIPFLQENYSAHGCASIVNEAIWNGQYISLFRIKPKYWQYYNPVYLREARYYRVPSGFASMTREHVVQHAVGRFEEVLEIDELIEEIVVPCGNLKALIDKLCWNKVDVLQVDAEGNDDIVLYASNIDSLEPKIVRYEALHLGNSRSRKLVNYLKRQGYYLHGIGKDVLAMRFM